MFTLVGVAAATLLALIQVTSGIEVTCGDLGRFDSGGDFYNVIHRPFPSVPVCALADEFCLRLTTRRNPEEVQILSADNTSTIRDSNFQPKKATKILIHGWLDKWNRPIWKAIASELLKEGDHNVIRLDWSEGNWFPYVQAAGNLRLVGAYAAKFVHHIVTVYKVNPKDIHIIGHSLGSHGAGYTGSFSQSVYNITVGRITGLDPAGPYFTAMPESVRLDPSDAEVVDTMITNGDKLLAMGSPDAMGHLNVWPNGGVNQPGCVPGLITTMMPLTQTIFSLPGTSAFSVDRSNPFDILTGFFALQHSLSVKSNLVRNLVLNVIDHTGCSHVRALQLFRDSIDSSVCNTKAYECDSYASFLQPDSECAQCNRSSVPSCTPWGYHTNLSLSLGGIRQRNFYTATTARSPYCSKPKIQFTLQALPAETTSGKVYVTLYGSHATSSKLLLTPRNVDLKAGQTYSFFPQLSRELGTLEKLVFYWESSRLALLDRVKPDRIHLEGSILATDQDGTVTVFQPARTDVESRKNLPTKFLRSYEQ
ncbi:putative Pancreatic triacylglycerol lipase [Hypsibius exemplaris]|uniref:Pancreatic triacylglycerol lipase n=1 Tax=Hypsibius exemplaris TaxID=2072580 RepID=A0A1W0X6J3_HYPEX|nr:putative Pancreatic triacylglycerol lipase [Hypsibius exemplaris]